MKSIVVIFYLLIFPIISLKEPVQKICINCKYFIPDNNIGVYGTGIYGYDSYGNNITLNLNSDRYGNVYNSDFNIDSKIDSVLLTRITHFSLKNRTAKQV